jgi:alpha-ketoglutarate-dependent taurine dioxygenase
MTGTSHAESSDPMAWTGRQVSKEDLVFNLSDRNVAALMEILERTRSLDRDEITLQEASHPALDRDLRRVYEDVTHGRGLTIVRGFPVDHPLEDVERMYWAFACHFGSILSTNALGNKMIVVRQEVLADGTQSARGTKSASELAMHNDSSDIFMLLCVHAAQSGGESQFSSGPAAHATISETHPSVLPVLYRGFPHHRRGEQYDHQPAVTPYDIPVFSHNHRGEVAINFTYSSIVPAYAALGRMFTEEEESAIDVLRQVLDDQQIEFGLRPGEVSVANNYAMCHSRSDYVDGDDFHRRRTVLRVWTEVPADDRRLPVGREYFHMENAGGRLGYDPIPGRVGRVDENELYHGDQELAELIRTTQAKRRQ